MSQSKTAVEQIQELILKGAWPDTHREMLRDLIPEVLRETRAIAALHTLCEKWQSMIDEMDKAEKGGEQ